MSLNLYDVTNLDPEIVHTIHELLALMKSPGMEAVSKYINNKH